jgi:hypothetical protein
MLHATINGKSYEFRENGSILEAYCRGLSK